MKLLWQTEGQLHPLVVVNPHITADGGLSLLFSGRQLFQGWLDGRVCPGAKVFPQPEKKRN